MNIGDIAFPNLGLYFTDVPRSFSLFGVIDIAVYGCIIGTGILLALTLAGHDLTRRGLSAEPLWDLAPWAIFFAIAGARTYYVVFSWDSYKNDLLSILNIRQGGLAIYGGVIGGFLTIFIYCRIKKVAILELFDSVAMAFPLGQAIGRWGNFFNREAFGGWSENLLAMRLPIAAVRSNDISEQIWSHVGADMDYIQVHPTFLYESMWNLCLLCILYWYSPRKKFKGEVFLGYLMLYGIGRFWIEGLRTDQLTIGGSGVAVSQAVGISCAVACLAAVLVIRRRIVKDS